MGLDISSLLLLSKFASDMRSRDTPMKILIAGRPKIYATHSSLDKYSLLSPHLVNDMPYYGESIIASIFGCDLNDVDVLDKSSFEGASVVFDLSANPSTLETSLRQKYNLVLDLGTSEHVGSPVNSIFNLLSCVGNGGYYISVLPHTGNVDHGFVSFSRCFFESMGLIPQIQLVQHHIYKEISGSLTKTSIWDALHPFFSGHLDGIADGSFLCHVLNYLNISTNHFTIFRVNKNLHDFDELYSMINQFVYLRMYALSNPLSSQSERIFNQYTLPYEKIISKIYKINPFLACKLSYTLLLESTIWLPF